MAIKTIIESLKTLSIQIRDEKKTGANTATRIGSLFLAICESLQSVIIDKFLRKDQDDRSQGTISSDKGFEAGSFEPEVAGAACYQDENGNWHIETDHLRVRKKAIYTEVEIQDVHHIGGQMMLSAADMAVDYVYEMSDRYRCYYLKKDSDGREVENLWKAGDQAYCNTFNLVKQADGTMGNHYLWRLVLATNLDTEDKVETRTFGEVTIRTSDYNFVDLSKEVCAVGSDVPLAGDEIVHLGYQGDDDPDRQNAILIAGAGSGSPYIYEFKGINSFVLPEPETKLKPGDNLFTGLVHIKDGSTGASNLKDLPDVVGKAMNVGVVNLLHNSGFTGDYCTEDLTASYSLQTGSELFSNRLKHWTGTAIVSDEPAAVSGKNAVIGSLAQAVEVVSGESYVLSFKAKGTGVKVSLGSDFMDIPLTPGYERYSAKFISDGVCTFSISGDATICDLQLERGTVATDWKPSPYDNDSTLAEFQTLKYLQDAMVNGSTSVLGGLILSSIIKLGNYKDGEMQRVNAGMSGIYNDDDDVAFWGGGTFEQAIRTVVKFKENPYYIPTDKEWMELANFVVSHGGNAFFRGYIYAMGGYFRGTVDIAEGKTLLKYDGSGHLADGAISWNKYGIMYRKSHDNIQWINIRDYVDTKMIDLSKGTYWDITYNLSQDTFELPVPEYDNIMISLKWEQISRSNAPAILSGNFRIRTLSDGEIIYVSATLLRIEIENKEVQLVYKQQENSWIYSGEGGRVDADTAYIGLAVDSSTEVVAEKVTSDLYVAGGAEGLTETISISDAYGVHTMNFTAGLLTTYSYESTNN